MIIERTRRRLIRGHLRLRGDAATERQGDKVIRVPLGVYGREYAYLCRGAQLGDTVEVYATFQGSYVMTSVIGFGRGGYRGPLKRARVLR
jgi:hypothetical protein